MRSHMSKSGGLLREKQSAVMNTGRGQGVPLSCARSGGSLAAFEKAPCMSPSQNVKAVPFPASTPWALAPRPGSRRYPPLGRGARKPIFDYLFINIPAISIFVNKQAVSNIFTRTNFGFRVSNHSEKAHLAACGHIAERAELLEHVKVGLADLRAGGADVLH